ncbi:hypothetical protein TrRE_jg1354, partial [Triparma retinervis]
MSRVRDTVRRRYRDVRMVPMKVGGGGPGASGAAAELVTILASPPSSRPPAVVLIRVVEIRRSAVPKMATFDVAENTACHPAPCPPAELRVIIEVPRKKDTAVPILPPVTAVPMAEGGRRERDMSFTREGQTQAKHRSTSMTLSSRFRGKEGEVG